MRITRVSQNGIVGAAVKTGTEVRAVFGNAALSDLDALVAAGGSALADAAAEIAKGAIVDEASLTFLSPLVRPSKIICLGLNYADHAKEAGLELPDFPTLFGRFPSSLMGHGAPIILPKVSHMLDYEGELAVVIGSGGKNISRPDALNHVAAYSIFNDASIRDYQMRTPQWTAGKNFDDSGAFGPWLVTPDELPGGAEGLSIQTRLNGQVVQDSNTSQLIFDVAATINLLSSFLTLVPGDLIIMGTPAGVGFARKPQLFMKAGDICEVEIGQIGILRNPIVAEA